MWYRLKLSDIDKSHLEHFSAFRDKNFPAKKEYIRNMVIFNICLLYGALIFFERKWIAGISITIVSMLHLIFLLLFFRKEKPDKKKMHLIYGIYQEMLGINGFVFGYAILKKEIGKTVYGVIGMSVVAHLILTFVVYLFCKKRICEDYYKKAVFFSLPKRTLYLFTASFISIMRYLDLDFYLVWGYLMVCLGIAAFDSIIYVLKYYCCKLLEMRDYIEGDEYPE